MYTCAVAVLSLLATFGQGAPQNALRVPRPPPTTHNAQTGNKQQIIGEALICLVCIDVIAQAKQSVADPKMQNKIETSISAAVCTLFPEEEGDKCRTRVKIYGPLAFEVIKQSLDPKTFCQDLALCADAPLPPPPSSSLPTQQMEAILASAFSPSPSSVVPRASRVTCYVCLMTVQRLERALTANVTENKLIAMADRVCLVLPRGVEKYCLSFMQDTLVMLVQMITSEEFRPLDVCRDLLLCPAHDNTGIQGGHQNLKTILRFWLSMQNHD